ncbi:transposase [Roseovarius marisflavi]|uniref:transposase n=1 Tax=Roseovarius marisflavi TaxID=1054996 RepID=UPI000A02C1E8
MILAPAPFLYHRHKHCVFHRRRHLARPIKNRLKALPGDVSLRMRDVISQICTHRNVEIIMGELFANHILMFVSIQHQPALSDLIRQTKKRSPHKVQREFPHLKKRYRGRPDEAKGNFQRQRWDVRRHPTLVP